MRLAYTLGAANNTAAALMVDGDFILDPKVTPLFVHSKIKVNPSHQDMSSEYM